ncbi:MAG: 2-amino-4-hydroxy-6-hydroxymethyldihydropteridine diphosphokinase [Bacteroidota bacterium]
MSILFLLLGSNVGDSRLHLRTAISLIQETVGVVMVQSSIYKTEPWGNKNQQDFLNQVLEVHTEWTPEEVLERILKIEQEMGRSRIEKWEPRIIDIDILFYGNAIIQTEPLRVPHPLLHERRFTLLPLSEIAPDLMHPELLKTVTELMAECTDNSSVSLYE